MSSAPCPDDRRDGLAWLFSTPATVLEPVLPGPGQDRATLERWHAEGLLSAVAGGVYLALPWAGLPVARCGALRTLLRSGAVVAMSSAVWARGGPGRRPLSSTETSRGARDRDDHQVDLLLPACAGRVRPREGVRTRQLAFGPADVEHRHGVPLTQPVRTAVDLVMWGTDRDQDALDWLWAHEVTTRQVRDDLSRRATSPWTFRGLEVLARVRRGEDAPLAAVPLTDPVTVWADGRDALSPNVSR